MHKTMERNLTISSNYMMKHQTTIQLFLFQFFMKTKLDRNNCDKINNYLNVNQNIAAKLRLKLKQTKYDKQVHPLLSRRKSS